MIYVIYGSTTGNTQHAAQLIAREFSGAEVYSAAQLTDDMLSAGDFLILGTSSWNDGEMQDDWDRAIDLVSGANLSGKKAAVFGMGDQEGWSDNFVSGMRPLYDALHDAGATIIGSWDTEGYDFDHSEALEDDKFVGLALDEDNQGELTGERIQSWCAQIQQEM
jgi:flavodoxin long chain